MDKSGQIIELDNELDNEFSDLAATGAMFNLLQKQVDTLNLLDSITQSLTFLSYN